MKYCYDGEKVIAEYDGIDNLLRKFVYDPGIDEPYFAEISGSFSRGLEYLMPILFSVVLVALDKIQEHLENPFDQIGEDDIIINAEKFISRLNFVHD